MSETVVMKDTSDGLRLSKEKVFAANLKNHPLKLKVYVNVGGDSVDERKGVMPGFGC